MTRFLRSTPILLCLFLAVAMSTHAQESTSTLIIHAQVADGTGKPLRKANVRITNDRITEISPTLKPKPNEKTIDAKGLVLSPGFIDIHNHSTEGLDSDPLAETQISQGITSLVVGADGDSPWPSPRGSTPVAKIPPP